jgi:hypothetical protein
MPARLSDIPVTGLVTPERYTESLSALETRISVIDKVIEHYQHVIGDRDSDLLYDELLTARARYSDMLSELNALKSDFAELPRGHVVALHDGMLYGDNLRDSLLHDRVRQIDFSRYESTWNVVKRAEDLAEQVPAGHTMVDGKVVPISSVIPFKEDAYWQDLSPSMNRALHEALSELRASGVELKVSEGWKLGYHGHVSGCHADGTCVDLAPLDGANDFSGRDIYEIFTVLKPEAKRLLLESRTSSGTGRLKERLVEYLMNEHAPHFSRDEAFRWMHDNADIETKGNATADNLHFEPLNGESVGPVAVPD